MKPYRLCLIEDDEIMGESLCDRFALEGYACDWYRTGHDGLAGIADQAYALVISDYRLPDMTGEAIFRTLLASRRPLPPVLFITAYGAIDTAVQLLKLGAADYLTKPFDIEALLAKVADLCVADIGAPSAASAQLGVSTAMRQVQGYLPRLAAHARTVLITGESGVGKERVAACLHSLAGGERPFIAVNCGAISESLLEAELFGHEKGAFTGAVRSRKGVFEQADGGTLFLDEIGEMPLAMQVRLLRAIQERVVVRVGGETPIPVDIRLICATNRDLQQMVREGSFREDLFYRIHVVQLRIPPLRERREDILWLAEQFLGELAVQQGGERKRLSPEAQQALLAYPWPGNVRELKHLLERASLLAATSVIQPGDIFEFALAPKPDDADSDTLARYLQRCERAYIERALARHQGHVIETAADLGISRKNLWEKMRKLGLSAEDA